MIRIRKELCSAWAAQKALRDFLRTVWLNFCDYEIAGRTLKLDFSRYDVVLWAAENHSLEKLFGFTHVLSSLQLWIACLCYFSVPCSPTPMFHPQGPTLRELAVQALSSTERGYDLLAPKFDYTPFRTPEEILGPAMAHLAEPHSITAALDVCCGTGAALRHLRPLCRDRVVGIDFSRRDAGYRPTGDGGRPRRGADRPGLWQRAPHAI